MRSDRISVLVVEDEPIVRLGIVMELEDAGFNVYEAANTDEALLVLNEHPEIHALFTDVEMPGGSMDGLTLAAAVHDRWPPVKIIVTSGRVERVEDKLPEDAIFMPKPYTPHVITSAIRNLVGA